MNKADSLPGEESPAPPSTRTVVGDSLSSLVTIYEPDVNVCVVRRTLPFSLDEAGPAPDESTVRCFKSEGVGGAVAHEELAADLAFLAEVLSDLTGADDIGVRVNHGASPMCPQFHVDNLPVRLVCTYLGPGTEWMEHGAVRTAVAGDLVLLKGEGWVGNEGRGAVHRSPAHRSPRLVASLDPLWTSKS